MAASDALVTLELPAKGAPQVEAASVLAGAVFPCTQEAFFAEHWRRKALAIVPRPTPAGRAAAEARFAHISLELFDLDLDGLLANSASERIFAWMREGGAPDGAALRSFELESASAAATVHACGGSLYFRAPPSFCEEWVGAVSAQLGLGAGARHPSGELRGEVEVFASRAGHVTDWHFDFMENITFQLRGSKTWRLHSGAGGAAGGRVEEPVRGATPHYARAGNLEQQVSLHRMQRSAFRLDGGATAALGGGASSVTLRAGSVLYFPAGMWHRVECEEDSLSLNLSLIGLTYAELVTDAARQLAYGAPSLRALVSVPPLAPRAAARDAARAQCARALAEQRARLAALRAVDLLPDCAFAPPPSRGYVDVLGERERLAPVGAGALGGREARGEGGGGGEHGAKRRKVGCAELHERAGPGGLLRLNPLAVLVSDRAALGEIGRRLEEAQQAAAEEEEEEEEEGEEGEEEAEGEEAGEEEGQEEEEEAASEGEGEDGGGSGAEQLPALYSLRVNFGSDDLAPHCRTVLAVPAPLEPLMDWLAALARARCNGEEEPPAPAAADDAPGKGQRGKPGARAKGGGAAAERGGAQPCGGAAGALLSLAEVEAAARATGLSPRSGLQVLRVLVFHGFASPVVGSGDE